DPTGGRPVAEAPVTMTTAPNQIAIEVGREIDPQTIDPEAIDIPTTGAGPSFITLGDNVAAIEQNIEQISEYGVLPQLVEETQHGPLPRVGADGLKPHEAYARPAI